MNKIFLILILLGSLTFAQVSADLTIENQQVVGTDFLFDIYLTRTGTNDLYLGNADFALYFESGFFTNPQIFVEGDESPGFCNFVPTTQSVLNNFATQDLYYNNTAVEIIDGNLLVININGPTPSTQTNFNTRVAKIDNATLTHRLGRFRVSGVSNPAGFMGLEWKTAGPGVYTIVFSLESASPFLSLEANINAVDPGNEPLPVELTSFIAAVKNNSVTLKWNTATEINNYGFEIERCVLSAECQEWNRIGFVSGNGNSSSDKEYSFTDKNISGGSKFSYRLKQIDNDGQFEYSDIIEVEVVPQQFELSQNYPNPFNPSTTIRFSLPVQTQLKINIYNMLGELVKTISDNIFEPGFYNISFDASELSSGTYIYRLESDGFVETKKMILLK